MKPPRHGGTVRDFLTQIKLKREFKARLNRWLRDNVFLAHNAKTRRFTHNKSDFNFVPRGQHNIATSRYVNNPIQASVCVCSAGI